MGRELYFECPYGADCKKIWEIVRTLSGRGEEQEKRILDNFAVLKEKEFVTCQEAEERIQSLELETDIEKKLLKTLHMTKKTELPLWEGEDAFYYLAAIGIGLDTLGISNIKVNALGEGTKSLIQNGESSLIRKILEKSHLQAEFLSGEGELLTLNCVAFLASFTRTEKFSGAYSIKKSVCTGGTNPVCGLILERNRDETEEGEKYDTVQVLETNVDDCSGEQLGYAIECLMKAGALDASCFPVYMKKHRPAYMLQVICTEKTKEALEDIIFRETTSIGLRRYEEKRRILPRSLEEICLKDGHRVKIKICEHHGQNYYYPEYETVKKVCMETGRPYRSVYDEAAALAGGFR